MAEQQAGVSSIATGSLLLLDIRAVSRLRKKLKDIANLFCTAHTTLFGSESQEQADSLVETLRWEAADADQGKDDGDSGDDNDDDDEEVCMLLNDVQFSPAVAGRRGR